MSRPCFRGGIPLVTRRIIESAVTTGPIRKICEGVLIKEPQVVVKEVGRQLSNLNIHSVAHNRCVFLRKSIRDSFEDLLENQGTSSSITRCSEQPVLT